MEMSFGITLYKNVPAGSWRGQPGPLPLVFGVRGTGPLYDDFWKWMRDDGLTGKAACAFEEDDFPWSYFAFRNPADAQRFRDRWANHITLGSLDD